MSENAGLLLKDFLLCLGKNKSTQVYYFLSCLYGDKDSFHLLIDELPMPIEEFSLKEVLEGFFLRNKINDDRDVSLYQKYQHMLSKNGIMRIKVFNENNVLAIDLFDKEYATPAQMWKELSLVAGVSSVRHSSTSPSYVKINSILDGNSIMIEKSKKDNSKSYYNFIKSILSMDFLNGAEVLNILSKLGCDDFSKERWNDILGTNEHFRLKENIFNQKYSNIYSYFKDCIPDTIWGKDFKSSVASVIQDNIKRGHSFSGSLEIIEGLLENGSIYLKHELSKIGFSLDKKELLPMNDKEYNRLKDEIYSLEYFNNPYNDKSRNEDVLLGIMVKESWKLFPPNKGTVYNEKEVDMYLESYLHYIEKKHLDASFNKSDIKSLKKSFRV